MGNRERRQTSEPNNDHLPHVALVARCPDSVPLAQRLAAAARDELVARLDMSVLDGGASRPRQPRVEVVPTAVGGREAASIVRDRSALAFDRQRGPLARALVIPMADGSTVIGLVADVAVADQKTLEAVREAISARMVTELVGCDLDQLGDELTLVHDLVRQSAATNPNDVAVVHGAVEVTYAKLDAVADRIADELVERGIAPETPIGVLAERSIEMLAGLLAVFRSAGYAVLLDPGYPPARLRETVRAAGTNLVLAQGDLCDLVGDEVETLPLQWRSEHTPITQSARVNVSPDSLAYAVLTSGSTGAPKLVGVPHRSVADSITTHCTGYRLTAADRGSWLSPSGSSVSVGEIWPILAAGGTVHIADDDTVSAPTALREWLVAQEITVTYAGMPLAEALYTLEWPSSTALRLLVVGSDTVRLWGSAALPFEVAVSIGSSEANAVSSCITPWGRRITSRTADSELRRNPPPVGRAWPGIRVSIVDDDLRAVPRGVGGELGVTSSQLARGYLNDPRATAEVFVPDAFSGIPGARMYRTGDLVSVDGDDVLRHRGRIDAQLKINGMRVEPAEVESTLLAHSDITECVVTTREGPSGGNRLVAYLIGARTVASALRSFLAERLPAHAVPSAYVWVGELPRLMNGKIDRRALPDPEWVPSDLSESTKNGGAITDKIEKAVMAAWRDALDIECVGLDDDFYLLGGDSMAGNVVAGRLSRQFAVRITVRVVLMRPTPRGLAETIRNATGGQA